PRPCVIIFITSSADTSYIPSFPTRRSSDLGSFAAYTTAEGLPSNQVFLIFPDFNGEPVITTTKGPVYLRGGKIVPAPPQYERRGDRKSTRLNSSHDQISYAVFCLKKKNHAV